MGAVTRRRVLLALGGAVAAAAVRAQPRMHRIGFLHPGNKARAATHLQRLREGLQEYGYAEGRNIVLEMRVAEGRYDRLPGMAAELVRARVDLIVTGSTPATRAAKEATTTIPIVMSVAGDAIATGLVTDLARPEGNVTGATYFDPELAGKRVELLREGLPHMRRLGVLMNPSNPQAMGTTLKAVNAAARAGGVDVVVANAEAIGGLEAAFSILKQKRVDAVKVVDDPLYLGNLPAIARLARAAGLPSAGAREFGDAGGLLGYGPDLDRFWMRASYFVDKILKGAKPADIPIERATEFSLVVNLDTAKALGVVLPPALLVRADRVIG